MSQQAVPERANAYDYEHLLKSARGELFGPGYAQLPLPPMLMFDRITRIEQGGGRYNRGLVRAELDLDPEMWFFKCHFHGDPVMPGCLGLDALWQMTGFYLCWAGFPGRGRALGGEIKFTGQATTDIAILEYGVDMRRTMRSGRVTLGIADGFMRADGETIYEATNLRVGLFRDPDGTED